jgi:hypothetical protein
LSESKSSSSESSSAATTVLGLTATLFSVLRFLSASFCRCLLSWRDPRAQSNRAPLCCRKSVGSHSNPNPPFSTSLCRTITEESCPTYHQYSIQVSRRLHTPARTIYFFIFLMLVTRSTCSSKPCTQRHYQHPAPLATRQRIARNVEGGSACYRMPKSPSSTWLRLQKREGNETQQPTFSD